MRYVFDCSFSAALFIPDENAGQMNHILSKIQPDDEITVPVLWWYEINNVLAVSVKRNRIRHADAASILNLFEGFLINTDTASGIEYSRSLFEITQLYQLTAYDAAYLELSIRTGATLLSLDKQLNNAAQTAGLKTLNEL